MKKITRKQKRRVGVSWVDEKKEAMRFLRVEIARITGQRDRLQQFIKGIALEVDEVDDEFQYLFNEMGLERNCKVEVWSSEWEELQTELQSLNFDNRDLNDEMTALIAKNEKLEAENYELRKAFDEVRALNIPQASKNKKTKI